MYSRVKKVFIGKNVDWTATASSIYDSTGPAAAGEVYVLNKNMEIMTAGQDYTDTNIIYIAEATADTYSYVTEGTGTSVTGVRKFILSDAIDGALVRTYSGKDYVAPVAKAVTIAATGAVSAGTEYVLRIVYKDIKEHPGQFTHTYRVVATDALGDTLYNAFEAQINADSKARITALANQVGGNDSGSDNTLTLTAKAISNSTTSLNDIDEYSVVDFDVFFYYVSVATGHEGEHVEMGMTQTVTNANPGKGTWYQVRDAEKASWGQQFGIWNRTNFPIKTPTQRTLTTATYDQILIESDKMYLSPDNGYDKVTKVATEVYLYAGATQNAKITAVLNPWMASLPRPFDAVVI